MPPPPSPSDLQVAAIQRLLLPEELPQPPGWDIASHYQPCEAASGDFYGFQTRTSDRIGLLVADVSGHGVRAAVVSAMLRAWLESHLVFQRESQAIADDLNRLFMRIQSLGVFVTAFFANISLVDGSFRYINCGHPYARILRASGSIDELRDGHCLPLGILDDLGLAGPGHATIESGDSLVIYTDGITEATSPDNAHFDVPRLDQAIAGSASAADTVNRVVTAVANFRQSAPRLDDECLLVIKRI